MPDASQPIISVGAYLDQVGGSLEFTATKCYLKIGDSRTLVAERNNKGLYTSCSRDKYTPSPEHTSGSTNVGKINLSVEAQLLREKITWLHRTCAHIGKERLRRILSRHKFSNLRPEHVNLLLDCNACNMGKIKRGKRPRTSSSPKPKTYGHTLFSDSTGRQTIATAGKKRYANITVDAATRWCHVKLLRSLKDTLNEAIAPLIASLGQNTLKILRTDLGPEFMNKPTSALLQRIGAQHQKACADEHWQNGTAERTIGVLFETVRTLMADSKLPLFMWGECLRCAAYLRNRLPCKANTNHNSPFEARYGQAPNLTHLRPFGSHCTVLKHGSDIRGMRAKQRGLQGVMVGYGSGDGVKGYRIYIPEMHKIKFTPYNNARFVNDMASSLKLRPPHLVSTRDTSTLAGIAAEEDHKYIELSNDGDANLQDRPENGRHDSAKSHAPVPQQKTNGRHPHNPDKPHHLDARSAPNVQQKTPGAAHPSSSQRSPNTTMSTEPNKKFEKRSVPNYDQSSHSQSAHGQSGNSEPNHDDWNRHVNIKESNGENGAEEDLSEITWTPRSPTPTGPRRSTRTRKQVRLTNASTLGSIDTETSNRTPQTHADTDFSNTHNGKPLSKGWISIPADHKYLQRDENGHQLDHNVTTAQISTAQQLRNPPSWIKREEPCPKRDGSPTRLIQEDKGGHDKGTFRPQHIPDEFLTCMDNISSQFNLSAIHTLAENPFAADVEVPTSYRAALQGPHADQWKEAIDSEIKSLQTLGVYRLVSRSSIPQNANIISGKWVFKVKPNEQGHVERFKTRLCARGFLQKCGGDIG